MKFMYRVLLEHSIKYIALFLIGWTFWGRLNKGLHDIAAGGKLEAIAVIMSVIALASISGYFAFSYTQVAKSRQRLFGYICTFFLGLSMMLSLLIVFFVATIWAPELSYMWSIIITSLFIGIALFDNLDLMRMGLDVSATEFFESGNEGVFTSKTSPIRAAIDFLRGGHHLTTANGLIGQVVLEHGREIEDQKLIDGGQWIMHNADASQDAIDRKIVELFRPHEGSDRAVKQALDEIEKGLPQPVADQMIATVIERLHKLK